MTQRKTSLLQRLTAAALSVGLLLTLTACSGAPAETTQPVTTEPVITQSTEQTVPETTAAPELNYENLVTDAYTFAYRDDDGFDYCYHIPKVNLESCAAINSEMYTTLMEIINVNVHQAIEEYDYPDTGYMLYTWGHREDVVSILANATDAYTEWTEYHVFYLNPETGARCDKAALLQAYGLTEQSFSDQVYAVLRAYWDEKLQSEAYQTDDYLKKISGDLVGQTLAPENIAAAIPYIESDGRLTFLATVYVPAGAGEYKVSFDFETGEQLPYRLCTVDHTADLPAEKEPVINLSAEDAYAIACEYWDYQEGDVAEETGFELYLVENGTFEEDDVFYYGFLLRWLVSGEDGSKWLSTIDQVYVNAETGECSYLIN